MPSRGGIRGPVASMGCGWPANHWKERPTVCRYTLDCSHHCPLNTRASVVSRVVLTYKDFDGAEYAQHDSHLVHIVDILRQNDRVL